MSDSFNNPPPPPSGAPSAGFGGAKKDKMAAGLLAIFLGSLGIHKFYLGGKQQKKAAIIMLVVTVVGTCVLVGPIIMGVISLIEGILYLTKDDADFQAEYVQGDKAWF